MTLSLFLSLYLSSPLRYPSCQDCNLQKAHVRIFLHPTHFIQIIFWLCNRHNGMTAAIMCFFACVSENSCTRCDLGHLQRGQIFKRCDHPCQQMVSLRRTDRQSDWLPDRRRNRSLCLQVPTRGGPATNGAYSGGEHRDAWGSTRHRELWHTGVIPTAHKHTEVNLGFSPDSKNLTKHTFMFNRKCWYKTCQASLWWYWMIEYWSVLRLWSLRDVPPSW